MIKIEKAVFPSPQQWEAVIRGVRNPFDSWAKSDSKWNRGYDWLGIDHQVVTVNDRFVIGEADLALMAKLSKAGDDHGKFLRMLPVVCDITAPLYWWPEMDQYKLGTVTNSCSTIHTLHKKPFTMDDFGFEDLYEDEPKEKLCFDVEHDYSKELWKPVEEIKDFEISNYGRLINTKTGNIRTPGINTSNYKKYTVQNKNYYAHRLVAKAFIPNPDNLPQVNHKDGNKWNNDVNNLEWVTASENAIHAVKIGVKTVSGYTKYRVSRTARRFNDIEVEHIKQLFSDGYTKKEIATIMNCCDSIICNILNGKVYREIEMTPYDMARIVVEHLNNLREKYLETQDEKYWVSMAQILPRAYNQKRTWFTNYQTLKHIYHARKNHRLQEWHDLCAWIEHDVPYSKVLIIGKQEDNY